MLRIVSVAVVALLLGAGCGLRHPACDRDASRPLLEPPDTARRLQVVRVLPGTRIGASGFPISSRPELTAAHVCDEGLALNVDGVPTTVNMLTGLARPDALARRPQGR